MASLFILLLGSALLGTAVGYLFQLKRSVYSSHPLRLPIIGLLAGLTAFILFQVLTHTTGAPLWLLPLLIILQVWLWLGPLGPKQ